MAHHVERLRVAFRQNLNRRVVLDRPHQVDHLTVQFRTERRLRQPQPDRARRIQRRAAARNLQHLSIRKREPDSCFAHDLASCPIRARKLRARPG
jgi:hypothetical protein